MNRHIELFTKYINDAETMDQATDSENTHQNVHEALTGPAYYYRLNVEHGLGKMKLDAWKDAGGGHCGVFLP